MADCIFLVQKLVPRHCIVGAGVIKGLVFAMGGRRLATNSSDRSIHQFMLLIYPPPPEPSMTYGSSKCQIIETELEHMHQFNDLVLKVTWHAISYSPDGERLAGSAADPVAHKIYIWDIIIRKCSGWRKRTTFGPALTPTLTMSRFNYEGWKHSNLMGLYFGRFWSINMNPAVTEDSTFVAPLNDVTLGDVDLKSADKGVRLQGLENENH
ncbi:hypothetical protein EDC04DRAFT_2610983 [Pisolithus marmoratus]|nr:hypothetical protein EDC04DRAFT_2610983 [Pisolithus marmoratus]